MMNIAIVHYHLNRGGVTQVIANHLRAVDAVVEQGAVERVALLHGGRQDGWPDKLPLELKSVEVVVRTIPALDYDIADAARPLELARQLESSLDGLGFSPDKTVLHVHNHALGKNVSLPGALGELARAGYGLLLHIHDFPEDFRPDEYRRLVSTVTPENPGELPAVLYPQAPQVHYAVLNGRDFSLLKEAGVQSDRLHLLPNPALGLGSSPSRSAARRTLAKRCNIPLDSRLVLYPVRGIRRKNLGEALLWSAMAGEKTHFGFTLAPLNPREQPSYSRWKQFAESLNLPCTFEIGARSDLEFPQIIAAADLLLTTSVAEGFGMVFLESWLNGRPLIGRDLPEITADFVGSGLRLDRLHPRLLTPVDWIGKDAFHTAMNDAYRQALDGYGRPAPADLRQQIDGLIEEGLVDFAVLSSRFQRQIIKAAREDHASRTRLLEINPWVSAALELNSEDGETVQRNARIVREQYSREVCGRRLLKIYRNVAASRRSKTLQAAKFVERILDSFLGLSRFHPIRIE